MFRFTLVLVALGAAGLFIGWQEWKLAGHAKPEPQAISAADLIAKGPGENAHIALTDYLDLSYSYVVEQKGKSWRRVWVPIVERDGEFHEKLKNLDPNTALKKLPAPSNVRIIAISNKARNDEDLARIFEAPALTGIIVNDIESLGNKETEILTQSFPGTKFSNVYLIQIGRTPMPVGGIAAIFGGSAVSLLAGAGFGLRSLVRK
jgi:hypothetical protein